MERPGISVLRWAGNSRHSRKPDILTLQRQNSRHSLTKMCGKWRTPTRSSERQSRTTVASKDLVAEAWVWSGKFVWKEFKCNETAKFGVLGLVVTGNVVY